MTATPIFYATNSVSIIAGHYCIAPGLDGLSHTETTEQMSFRYGASLCRERLDACAEARVYLWVNDIGIDPESRAVLRETFRIPDNYLLIAEAAGLSPADIRVLFESAARNKASTLLRKIRKKMPDRFRTHAGTEPSLLRCVEGLACSMDEDRIAYVMDGPDGENLVVKEGPNPKCSLILASLFLHIARESGCRNIINVFNSIYTNRIRLGIHVYSELFANETPISFSNYFCEDDKVRQKDFSLRSEARVD